MKTLKIIVILISLSLTSEAFSQPFHGGPPLNGPRREQIRKRINTIKIWKMTEELNLSEQQSEKFFPIYNTFESKRKEAEDQRFDLLRILDDLTLEENPSETEIYKLIDQLENIDQQMVNNRVEFKNKLKEILTTRQIGRLFVFEIKFQRQIQNIIRDVKMEMGNKMNKRKQR